MELPFATGFYEDPSKPMAAQECTNWMPQVPETNAFSQAYLRPTPGIELFATASNQAMRGFWVMNDIAYSVNGTTLYSVNSDGTATSIGTITGTGRVFMVDNGTQLCIIVPGSTGYIYTTSGGLVTISDTDFTANPSLMPAFKDGYFIHHTDSKFFISNLNDGTAYDALDFAAAEVLPDKITGLHVSRNELYVCGTETIEPFQNIGGADFPFQRIQGGVIPKGVKAPHSLINYDDSFVWVGAGKNEQPSVWRYNGASPRKLSTPAIDDLISDHTDEEQEAIFCTTNAEGGNFLLNLHLKDRTLVFDASTTAKMGKPVWHERKSKKATGELTNWRVTHIVQAYGVTLVGDNQSGNIGTLDKDTYTEYGDTINRVFSTQPFHGEGRPVAVSEMEIHCESGTATITGAGSDPHITRSFSDDGGYTFGNETSRSLGAQGNYRARQIWKREGQFSDTRVYRFVHDEPIKAGIFKLTAEMERT